MNSNNQLTLFAAGGLGEAVDQVFKFKDVTRKNKAGDIQVVGQSMAMAKRTDIAEALNLKGKDNKDRLDAAILERTDAGLRMVKAGVAGLSAEWTLKKFTNKQLANGRDQITVVAERVTRPGLTIEQHAAALGLDPEVLRKAQEDKAAAEAKKAKLAEAGSLDPEVLAAALGTTVDKLAEVKALLKEEAEAATEATPAAPETAPAV